MPSPEAALTRAVTEGAIQAVSQLARSLQVRGSRVAQKLSRRLPPDVPATGAQQLLNRLRDQVRTHPYRSGLVLSLCGAGSFLALRRATTGSQR